MSRQCFSEFWGPWSPRPKCPQTQCLLRALFLVHLLTGTFIFSLIPSWYLLASTSAGRRGGGALWSPFYKGTDPTMGLHPHDLRPSPRAPPPNTVTHDLWVRTQTSSPYRGAEATSLTQFLLSGLLLQAHLEISSLLPSCKVGAMSAVHAGASHRHASQAVMCPDELKSWIKWTQWAWALAGSWNTSLLASQRLLECHWQQPQGIIWPGREVT